MKKIELKKFLSIGIVLVVVFIGYYFLIFLPKETKVKNLTKNQSKCLDIENKIVNDYKQQNQSHGLVTAINHFNIKEEKCFVSMSDSFDNNFVTGANTYIIDGVEDKTLAVCSVEIKSSKTECSDTDGKTITKDKFDELEKQYLSE